MKGRSAPAVLLFILLPAVLFALDVSLNGENYAYHGAAELEKRSFLVSAGDGTLARGLPLQDILPLMIEAYRIEILTTDGMRRVENDRIAEDLPAGLLLEGGSGWDLRFAGRIYREVSRLGIWGEPLTERELEVWVGWEGTAVLKEEIRRFGELHDLSIKSVEVPSTASKLIAVLRGGGRPPDVVMIQSDNVPALSRAKAIQSLDTLAVPDLLPGGIQAFRWSDRLWAVPFAFDTQLLFYNPDLVDVRASTGNHGEARWTLRELERAAEELLGSEDIIPMAWNLYSAYWLVSFQLGFGKERLIGEDGGIHIDDPATAAALEYLLALMQKGLLEPLERDAMITYFATGRVGVILTGSYSIPHFRELGIPFAVAAYPAHPETGRAVSPLLDFKGFAVTRKTRRPVLSRRLIQHLSGPGVQQRFCSALSKMPANEAAWPVVAEGNPYFPALAQSYAAGAVVPPDRQYAVFKSIMWKLLRFVFSGQMTVREAMARGQEMIDAQLAEEQ